MMRARKLSTENHGRWVHTGGPAGWALRCALSDVTVCCAWFGGGPGIFNLLYGLSVAAMLYTVLPALSIGSR